MPFSHLSAADQHSGGHPLTLSLRGRVALLMVALSVALAGIMYAAQEWVVTPTFVELEATAAQRNVNRCVEAIQRDLHSLGNKVSDWGCWDDTYRYISDRNEQYVEANLVDETFINAEIDLICLIDLNREIVWAEARSPDHATVELDETFEALRDPRCPLTAPSETVAPRTGILSTKFGPILLAAHPIFTTKHGGPSRGSIVMGRFLDAAEVRNLASRVEVALRTWTVGLDPIPPLAQAMLDQGESTGLEAAESGTLDAYQIVDDFNGIPALVLRVETPRDVSAQGQVAARFATACMIVGSVITMGVVWLVLHGGVVSPLRYMAAHVGDLARRGDLQGALRFRRRDEIGTLANAFDGMVQRIRHIAFHDALTDLPNRASLMERLRISFERSQQDASYRFGVLFIDVDNFKLINDSLGHRMGDQLLRSLATAMREAVTAAESAIRKSVDTVARLGGDEFVVLLDDVGDSDALLAIAERIQRRAGDAINLGNRVIKPSLSIGAAISSPEYEDAGDVLRDADTALYHAKSQGKCQIALFDQAMRSEMLKQAHLAQDLEQAIAKREFVVHYQPIVDLETSRLACLEALVRWRHPTRGLVPPDEFIPVAEDEGLIEAIGEEVLEEVCRQIAAWRAEGSPLGDVAVSVNVTAEQLVGNRLLDRIDDCLERRGLDASALKIELTETTAIRAVDASRSVFDALAQRGLEIYLDDFGTGYSSLSALHSLPFSAIKLDRSFLRNLEREPENEATIRAMVMIAKTRRLRLIAEGVETADQLATLRELQCRYGQGFYFSRPRAADELEAMLDHDLTFNVAREPVGV